MKRLILSILLATAAIPGWSQDREFLERAFEGAGQEFSVPPDILKAVAFAETRWTHLTWEIGDTVSCMGMPHPYGIMALWDNAVFGHSLVEAAALIGQPVGIVASDPVQNIRAGAAWLRHLYDSSRVPDPIVPGDRLESWSDAIARYTGIRQPDMAYGHVYEVLYRLSQGYTSEHIVLPARVIDLTPIRNRVKALVAQLPQATTPSKVLGTPDYPLAKWVPGKAGYYYGENEGYGKQLVVVHDMEGYYASVISYFQTLNDGRSVSIHYCANGLQDSPSDAPAGDLTQMTEERFYAWHAVCLNRYSVGIEHEGFAGNPAWFSPQMYLASGKLTRYLCDKYGIPKDRNHIVGHGEWQNGAWVNWMTANITPAQSWGTCNSHTDPGPYWDWDFYMQIVKNDTTKPTVTSVPPAGLQLPSISLSVTFNQRMEPSSTIGAFATIPAMPGTFSWSTNGRTLSFKPSSYLPFDSTIRVIIDTSARNYLGQGLDLNGDGIAPDRYEFTVRTIVRDTIAPSVTSVYPPDGALSISRSAEFIVNFSEELDATTLSNGVALGTLSGTSVPVYGVTSSTVNGNTRIRFRSTNELQAATSYRISVLPTVKDLSGNAVASLSTTFTTGTDVSVTGTVLNPLDAIGAWWQPSTSGSTVNVLSSFGIDYTTIKSGLGSGKLSYTFTKSSGGVIREHNPTLWSVEGSSRVGVWVFGDKSGHDLRFGFYYYTPTTTFFTVSAGKIDWTGWKLVSVPTSAIPTGNGAARVFTSFLVYQDPAGELSGTLYFDDLTAITSMTSVRDPETSMVPDRPDLEQNFPNPFNGETSIRYRLPSAGHVRIAVYDVLGREVALLVDDQHTAGVYATTWDTGPLPSGTYVYRMRFGSDVVARKMVLTK